MRECTHLWLGERHSRASEIGVDKLGPDHETSHRLKAVCPKYSLNSPS